jgi:hypothetical protein
MAAAILMESYLMAFGLAVTLGEPEDEAHLFARNYDCPVTYKSLQKDYADFVNRRTELKRVSEKTIASHGESLIKNSHRDGSPYHLGNMG